MEGWLEEVQGCLGPPDRKHPVGGWERVAEALGAQPPADFVRFADSYGACIIKHFLYVNHPQSRDLDTLEVFKVSSDFLRLLREAEDARERIPYPLMGEPGGMLQWGHTDVGDYCFLRRVDDGSRWVVDIWYREGEWHESGLTFSEWMVREVRGVVGTCNVLRFSALLPLYESVC